MGVHEEASGHPLGYRILNHCHYWIIMLVKLENDQMSFKSNATVKPISRVEMQNIKMVLKLAYYPCGLLNKAFPIVSQDFMTQMNSSTDKNDIGEQSRKR